MALSVRSLAPGDEPAVRALFAATIVLGRPLPFPVPDLDRYADLCLGWYLTQGRTDGAVLCDDSRVVGYALVCLDNAAHTRWLRQQAARWVAVTVAGLAHGRYPPPVARFYRLRLADGWTAWRRRTQAPFPAHAHLNLAGGLRARRVALRLIDHIDERCRAAGLPGWFGEINAPRGRRAGALVARGGIVVHRVPSRTFSWLLARPVERLTVARPLPPSTKRSPEIRVPDTQALP